MEKWLLKHRRLSVCLILTFLSTACGDVVYLYAKHNSSIEFSCVAPEESGNPFAFSLDREWIKKGPVLYHNFQVEPSVKDRTYNDRIQTYASVQRVERVNVSIMLLKGFDTDIYTCTFHYNTPTDFKNLSGRNKFLLYVEDYQYKCKCNTPESLLVKAVKDIEQCSYYSYTPLLLSLSAAAGLLFLIVLILTAVHCVKHSGGGQAKPQLSVPIYEEMNGVREKVSSHPQEDDASALYVRPRKENPYIN